MILAYDPEYSPCPFLHVHFSSLPHGRIIARSSTQLCAALATCLAGWAALKSDAPLAAPPAPPPGRPAARTVPQIGRFADGLP